MELKNFNKLFNQILFEESQTTIKYNTFNYKFKLDDNNILTCTYMSVDKEDNKLIKIIIKQFENGLYEYTVIKDKKETKYPEKQFMLKFYKDYKDFKHALSMYKKETETDNTSNITEKQDNDKEEIKIDGKTIPQINNFNDILTQETNIDSGILIKELGTSYTFKTVADEKYKNLITISFSFQNNENNFLTKTDLLNYDVICLAKITNGIIKLLNINLYDPDDLKETKPVESITESDFKERFTQIYFNLKNAMYKYLKQYLINKKF